ncbi:MAG: hypothetical protein ACR2IS_07020 [Nitrososphaeraceae archaeon]
MIPGIPFIKILIIFEFHPSLLADDTNRLKEFLHQKIDKRKKQIHPAHNPRFNHDLQLEIDCIVWALKKIEVNKLPIDRLEAVIRKMIKDLEKRKEKAMERSDTDDFWIKIESLQWVLFVIFAIKNGNMVVI